MEKVEIKYEGSFTQTLILNEDDRLKVLGLGKKYGTVNGNKILVKGNLIEDFVPQLYTIRGMEFKTQSPF